MDFSKINAAGARVGLPTKKVTDLKVRDVFTVNEVKEAKTQFGNKVILKLDDEFSNFLTEPSADLLFGEGSRAAQVVEDPGPEG